jgi:hypothetical protein
MLLFSSILSAAGNQLSVHEPLTLELVNPGCTGISLRGVAGIVLMTILGHDPFWWPYLVMAQKSVLKGSKKSWGQTLAGSEAVTTTYGKLVFLISRRCIA